MKVFDAATEWMLGSDNMAVALSRTFLVATGGAIALIAAIIAPLTILGAHNNRQMTDVIDDIDKGPATVFQSVADCEGKGFTRAACEASWNAARKRAGEIGNSVSYVSSAKCKEAYGQCDRVETSTTVMAGRVIAPITAITYYPRLIGWQASLANLDNSVVLYETSSSDTGMRVDGVRLTLR